VSAPAVEIAGLTKRFGAVEAVRDLSFSVQPGRVTGFLGPNGAGKSTTLRALLGLVRPTSGSATFGGTRYEELDRPSARVGAVLEDASFHPGRTGRNHLRVLAAAGGHPASRVGELLELVGLAHAADRRVKGYSMGMRQRLGIAAALLGQPEVLILDEPANGLDPPGIRWLRELMRAQAGEGRAVLVSSHLLAEVAQSADEVVVIAEGSLRAQGPLREVLGAGAGAGAITVVRTPDAERLGPGPRPAWAAHGARRPRRARRERRGPRGGGARGGRGGRRGARARRAGALARGRVPRPHGAGPMSALLRAELLKLRTTRTFVALVTAAAVLGVVTSGLSAALSQDLTREAVRSFVLADASQLFILLLGVVGMSGEWRHRTITSSVLAAPDRARLVLAKAIAYAVAGVVLSLVVQLLVFTVATVILTARDEVTLPASELADLLWRNLVLAAAFGAIGVGVGGLVRNQAVAVVLVLVVSFALEPLLLALVPAVGRFGPFVGASTASIGGDTGFPGAELLAPGLALLVLVAWVAVLCGLALALLQRRDLT
jgi:ABC-2 type transport system ATP-binding protein